MLLQMALFHSFLWMSNIPLYIFNIYLFIHSSVSAHLGYVHVLVKEYCYKYRDACIFWIIVLSGYMPRNDIPGSYGCSIFSFFFLRWIEFFIRKNAIFYRSPFMRILPKHYNKLALKRNTTMTENSKYCSFEEPATRLIENQHTTPTTPHTSVKRLYK